MVKSIETLVSDIEAILSSGVQEIPEELLNQFALRVAKTSKEKLDRTPREFTLRFSNIGKPCVRELWLDKNNPGGGEVLTPSSYNKFAFGDLTEEWIIFLIELSGHTVSLRQQEVELEGIQGHWDLIVDGMLLDVKSASSFSFDKFKEGLVPEKDAFGYLTQLRSYHDRAKLFNEVTDKVRAGFLVMDKQHGHIWLDIHDFSEPFDLSGFFKERIRVVNGPDLPERAFVPKLDGYKHKVTKEFIANGNELLDTNCSYCSQKFNCYDNIRTFIFSQGPKFFTKVVKEPKVLELIDGS